MQADVEYYEFTSNAAEKTLQKNIDAVQADVDANEAAANIAIAAVQADVEYYEFTSNTAKKTLQTNIDAVQADVDANEAAANTAIAAVQADVDNNELASNTADAELQAYIDEVQVGVDAMEAGIITAGNALKLELDTSQSGAGLQDDGSYVANASMDYISTATSIVDATEDLDVAIAELQSLINALTLRVDELTPLLSESYVVNSMDPAVFSDPRFEFMMGPGCDLDEFFFCDGRGEIIGNENVEITIPQDAYSATPKSIEVKLTFNWLDLVENAPAGQGMYLSLNDSSFFKAHEEIYHCDGLSGDPMMPNPDNGLTVNYEIPVTSWNENDNNHLYIASPCFVFARNTNGNYMELTFNY